MGIGYHLPMLLALASIALALESFHWFEPLDAAMLGTVNAISDGADAISDPAPPENPVALTLLVRDEAFNETFGRRLPADRVALGKAIDEVASAKPSVLAIDVDIAPIDPIPSDQDPWKTAPFDSIRKALEQGIHVVGVVYPGRAGDDWIARLCKGLGSTPPQGQLYLANADVSYEDISPSIIRMPPPLGPLHERKPSEEAPPKKTVPNPPLSLGLAAGLAAPDVPPSSRTLPYRQQAQALLEHSTLCALPKFHPLTHSGGAASTHDKPPRNELIHYRAPRVLQEVRHYQEDFAAPGARWRQLATGKVVVLGLSAFESLDLHYTPIGLQHGATIHTAIAASVFKPLRPNHAAGFRFDVLVGLFFLVVHGLLGVFAVWAHRHHMQFIPSLIQVLAPVLALAAAVFLAAHRAPTLLFTGDWINPVPMLLGLCIHTYAEGLHAGAHPASHGHKHLGDWWREWRDAVKVHTAALLGRPQGGAPTAGSRLDASVWWLVHLLLGGLALYGLAQLRPH